MRKVGISRSLFVIGCLSISLMAHSQTPVAERQQELIHLVKQDCGSCHGMTLKGGLGPALTQQALADKPKQFLIDTILYGREALAMPPWQGILTKDEVIWMVDQLTQGSDALNQPQLHVQTKAQDEVGQ
ncbi:cytochrome c [Litoribacillus peritrichatus]|uniref:Cytochrome c domain-containing protein n=1 Tax=Litoribacillus peritrichatus TaxID=718191 RepID=A0ABP7M5I8_9GAMM